MTRHAYSLACALYHLVSAYEWANEEERKHIRACARLLWQDIIEATYGRCIHQRSYQDDRYPWATHIPWEYYDGNGALHQGIEHELLPFSLEGDDIEEED